MNLCQRVVIGVLAGAVMANSQASVMSAAMVDKSSDILIKNGNKAREGEFSETVVVEFKSGSEQTFCSGVLVSPDAVLTAAHCGYRKLVPVRVTAASTLSQALSLGVEGYARHPAVGVPEVQSVGVNSFVVMDPGAVAQGRNLAGRDLMVIKLKKALISPAVPIAISSLSGLGEARYVRIAGFGNDGKAGTGRKLYADVEVVSARCGVTPIPGAENCEPGRELFARHPQGSFDSCPGDSGGPVYVRSQFAQYRLVGITSRASGLSAQCGGGTIVTLLDAERLAWIRSQVGVHVNTQALKPELPPCEPPTC